MCYEEEVFRLYLWQKPEGLVLFRKNVKTLDDESIDFADSGLLEQVWELQMDDLSNPITEVMIDTLPKNKIDVYILYQNYRMKKFSATIPYI